MKYLVVILILILVIILKKNLSEKFNPDLKSPEVLEIVKKGRNAFVKFTNNTPNMEKNYMIFYIDADSPNMGIWVEKKVTCEKEICEITLEKLNGRKYHLAIVETDGTNMSKLGKIVKFSDTSPFLPYQISPIESSNYTSDEPVIPSSVEDEGEVFNKEEEKNEEKTGSPSPYVVCGRNPKLKYVNDESDMEDIEYKSNCNEDKEIKDLRKKVDRSLWEEFKKGYLSVDLKLA